MYDGHNPASWGGGHAGSCIPSFSRISSSFIPRSTLKISLEPELRTPQSEVSSHLSTGPGQEYQEG